MALHEVGLEVGTLTLVGFVIAGFIVPGTHPHTGFVKIEIMAGFTSNWYSTGSCVYNE
jgi:hypothetical protein